MPDKFLSRIWGTRKGYVFLPYKTERWYEPRAIPWPSDSVGSSVAPVGADAYYCPNVFREPRRLEGNTGRLKWLYADLDPVDPESLSLRPTIAIRTSPGKYQALWELSRPIGPDRFKDLNQRLTYRTGADKGGWHLTKVLRIPGTYNHKYLKPKLVTLLWDDGPTYTAAQIEEYVKDVKPHQLHEPSVSNLILPAESRESIVRRSWDRFDARTRTLLSEKREQPEGDRSERLWELECRLLEAGLEPEEVFVVVRESVWNKFLDRGNSDHYLWAEVRKAHLHVGAERQVDPSSGLVRLRPRTISYADLLGSNITEPAWLVDDWWTLGSHGIIAGLPKSYKSLVSMDLALSVASDSPFLGQFNVNPKGVGPVIVVQQENSMSLLRDRLWKMSKTKALHTGNIKADKQELVVEFPPSVPLIFYNDFGFDMTMPEDREAIEEVIQREGAKLIVFDPLYLMIGGADENNAKEMRPILTWLLRIRNLYSCAVVVVHHWGKGSSDRKGRGAGGIKLLGSTTIYGWLEAALYLEAKHEGSDIQVVVEREFRERLSPPPTGFVLRMGDVGQPEYEWKASGVVGTDNKILSLLGEVDGMSYRKLQIAMGVGQKKIRADLAPLLNDGSIVVRTEGKEKRFYLAERAPDTE